MTAGQSGSFENERQARETPAVQAIYAEVQATLGRPHMDAHNARMLTTACDGTRVELLAGSLRPAR